MLGRSGLCTIKYVEIPNLYFTFFHFEHLVHIFTSEHLQKATQFPRRKAHGDRRSHFLFVSFLSWKIWLNSSVGIGGNPQGPMGVPIQRNTHPEGQATVSPVTTLPLKNVGGGGQRGWLRPGWNCTQEKFLSPYFTRWCNIGDCFGNHRLCKFPGIKQKEQLTKERRKSPTDKRPISSLNYPL